MNKLQNPFKQGGTVSEAPLRKRSIRKMVEALAENRRVVANLLRIFKVTVNKKEYK